jgi:hypothetical protein
MAKSKTTSNGEKKTSSLNDADKLTMRQIVLNAASTQRQFVKKFLDPRRDLNDECGYPETTEISVSGYQELYDRLSIATRVVEVLPKESWQTHPTIFETEDPEENTEFEKAWGSIADNLQEESWYQDEEGSPIWEYLLRADILSGIGHYGVLLLGIDDNLPLGEPVVSSSQPRKLTFLRPFPESLASITKYDEEITSKRFGLPIEYGLSFTEFDHHNEITSSRFQVNVHKVHYSRVLHLADNLSSSEVFGIPRQRPVFNRLLDLRKIYGGSAEMYWRGAFPGYALETHPNLGGELNINVSGLRDEMEEYMNGLQRYSLLQGMSMKSLAPQVVDPSPQIETQLDAICIQIGIPKRKFMGSERGELASSQDDGDWNDTLRGRQNNYITPRIIVKFINRCIHVGILPKPKTGFSVVWPDLDALSGLEQAEIALKTADALAKYIQGDVHAVVPPIHFLTEILDVEERKALEMLKEADELSDERSVEEDEQHMQEKVEGEERMRLEAQLKGDVNSRT